jgi:hypothetical protein
VKRDKGTEGVRRGIVRGLGGASDGRLRGKERIWSQSVRALSVLKRGKWGIFFLKLFIEKIILIRNI